MSEEIKYLNALEEVLQKGERRETRNGVTISKFGVSLEMDISDSFPLLTSKRMFFKGIVVELLWFLTNRVKEGTRWLKENGVHIWDGNTSREFLDSLGLHSYEEGECGPVYGYQWRNFNGKGHDQLAECLELLRKDPMSRRIFMSGWNPCQMHEMVLPPCHVSYQFYVSSETNQVSCSMYQRSGDMFLGVPFNIASTALMTYMMATMSGRKPGKIFITIGDAHIYESHVNAVQQQLSRRESLFSFPLLSIPKLEEYYYERKRLDEMTKEEEEEKKEEEKEKRTWEFARMSEEDEEIMKSLEFEDFHILDYQFHPTIKAPMIA